MEDKMIMERGNLEKKKILVSQKLFKRVRVNGDGSTKLVKPVLSFMLLIIGLIVFVFVFNLGLVGAQLSPLGCCFNPDDGLCSPNSETFSCESPGEFYSDSSCSSVSKCGKGCCLLGDNPDYTTYRSCEVLSRSFGFEFPGNFLQTSEESCYDLSTSREDGACLLAGEFERDCILTSFDLCPTGDFYPGISCTEDSLNSTCEETQDSICYKDDVYYKDSCGYADISRVKDNCSDTTEICRSISSKEAQCQNLNCGIADGEGRSHGDEWCYNEDPNTVGSRYFLRYCLNGEVYTEPAGDFRMESCVDGKIENNLWQECLFANSPDEETGANEIQVGACNERHCTIFEPEFEGLSELGLAMCLPFIPGGLDFWPSDSGFSNLENSVCSLGNFQKELKFIRTDRTWFLEREADSVAEIALLLPEKEWVGDGNLLHNNEYGGPYSCSGGIFGSCSDDGDGYVDLRTLPINSEVVAMLNDRCRAIADCDGKMNWVGAEGGIGGFDSSGATLITTTGGTVEAEYTIPLSSVSGLTRSFDYNYECLPFSAPEGDDLCSECGEDDLPCSEYRCKSLGQGCEYSEPSGADKGFCVASSDRTAPQITPSLIPKSPIPPYTAVEITINTDEISHCKFNLGDSGSNYDEMNYNVDKNWSTEHKTRLNLPGQKKINDEFLEYDLITEDGEYEMFVRCQDTAGNWNRAATLIEFEVLQTPDNLAPFIRLENFEPPSGSAIKYNSTERLVKFKIDEPVECRYSLIDRDYDDMVYEFDCDEGETDFNILNGYFCEGTLFNITLDINSQTDYFIRCEDQPYLEGIEDNLYQRNKNDKSVVYSLRASELFEIIEIAPKENVIKTSGDTGVLLSVITSGGGLNGISMCWWKISGACFGGLDGIYSLFSNTNSRIHTQQTSNLSVGSCLFEAICKDESLNEVNASSEFSIEIDNTSPDISRAYYLDGSLFVETTENAQCKYVTDENIGCGFGFDDEKARLMTGTEKEHTASWESGAKYYTKCKDFRGNENLACRIIIGTYQKTFN